MAQKRKEKRRIEYEQENISNHPRNNRVPCWSAPILDMGLLVSNGRLAP
jgi:hypothetical protein